MTQSTVMAEAPVSEATVMAEAPAPDVTGVLAERGRGKSDGEDHSHDRRGTYEECIRSSVDSAKTHLSESHWNPPFPWSIRRQFSQEACHCKRIRESTIFS